MDALSNEDNMRLFEEFKEGVNEKAMAFA